ncbi:MAG: HNH endonuclease family protein [Halobacteria archaeon]|nr:HNH endonuclease family protein [Halobacteria archaeon]
MSSSIRRLLALGRVANVLPVLMASQMRFGDDDPEKMAEIVRACETLVFRMYAVDGRRSDTGRGKLVSLAHSVYSDDSYPYENVIDRLRSITRRYVDDDRFERQLRDPEFYETMSSRDIKYLFYHYGRSLDIDWGENPKRDLQTILSADFEVEHILARNLSREDIPESLRDDFEDNIHRLGNLTVASRYWNSSYGDLPFEKKKTSSEDGEKAYASSTLRVQQVLTEYGSFGREEIEEREDRVVNYALEEWSIDPKGGLRDADEGRELPDGFFKDLSDLQEAFLRVLLEEDGWSLNEEIRQRIEQKHGLRVSDRGQALAGITSGFTRKYGNDFTWRELLDYRHPDDQFEFRLSPNSGYIEELREKLL